MRADNSADRSRVFARSCEVQAVSRSELDIAEYQAVFQRIAAFSPDIIINCAAYNEVDRAEDVPEVALAINGLAVRSIANAARVTGAVLVHYGSDFVFDGEAQMPYGEEHPPRPQSIYAMSKLLGEWCAAAAPKHYVLRLESVFGGGCLTLKPESSQSGLTKCGSRRSARGSAHYRTPSWQWLEWLCRPGKMHLPAIWWRGRRIFLSRRGVQRQADVDVLFRNKGDGSVFADGTTSAFRVIGGIRTMKVSLLIAFAGRRCGGPEVFEREIVRAMAAIAPQHEYHLHCLDRRAAEVIDIASPAVTYHIHRPSARSVSMLTSVPLGISRTGADVFHAPIVPPPFCPKNTIMSMPCSSLLRRPEFYPPLVRLRLRFLLHRAISKAKRTICPSEHVRAVVHEIFRIPVDRLPVIHPGVSTLFRPMAQEENRAHLEEKFAIRHPYLLFSGRWEERKNVVRIIEAFARFKTTVRSEHKLVLTGGRSWASNSAEKVIARLGLAHEVIDLGKAATGEELPHLYAGAEALVYASLWEGFGMPIVEAMACGTPVITSTVSAMPETAGGAALLVDPYSVEEIADGMARIVGDAALRMRLRSEGLKRAPRFTWQKAAKQTLSLYEELAPAS